MVLRWCRWIPLLLAFRLHKTIWDRLKASVNPINSFWLVLLKTLRPISYHNTVISGSCFLHNFYFRPLYSLHKTVHIIKLGDTPSRFQCKPHSDCGLARPPLITWRFRDSTQCIPLPTSVTRTPYRSEASVANSNPWKGEKGKQWFKTYWEAINLYSCDYKQFKSII